MYISALGKWLQRDPVGYADAIDLYGYGGNDPLGNVDPFGLFSGEGHPGITNQGLLNSGLNQNQINKIIEGNLGQDAGFGWATTIDHGDGGLPGIKATVATLSERWKAVFDGRNNCNSCQDVANFLIEFGKILHAIQDLYAHSNYAEVFNKAAGGNAKIGDLPLWNMTGGANNAPAIPPGITTGTFSVFSPTSEKPGTHGAMAHDTPGFPASKVKNANGTTMYDLARELATRHTAAAWSEFARQMAGSKFWDLLAKCTKFAAPTTAPATAPTTKPTELLRDRR